MREGHDDHEARDGCPAPAARCSGNSVRRPDRRHGGRGADVPQTHRTAVRHRPHPLQPPSGHVPAAAGRDDDADQLPALPPRRQGRRPRGHQRPRGRRDGRLAQSRHQCAGPLARPGPARRVRRRRPLADRRPRPLGPHASGAPGGGCRRLRRCPHRGRLARGHRATVRPGPGGPARPAGRPGRRRGRPGCGEAGAGAAPGIRTACRYHRDARRLLFCEDPHGPGREEWLP
jgi:hypothetical protein